MLADMEVQQFAVAQITFQMVAYLHRSHSCWRAGINQISNLQRKELADIRDDFVYREKHIRCIPRLDALSVYIQMEREVADFPSFRKRDECPECG